MSVFIDPTGLTLYGIGICDRCKRAFPIVQLYSDPNSPGLKVCEDDLDEFDPYRLAARQTERINLPFVRPDDPIGGSSAPTHSLIWFLYAVEGTLQIVATEDNDLMEVEPYGDPP